MNHANVSKVFTNENYLLVLCTGDQWIQCMIREMRVYFSKKKERIQSLKELVGLELVNNPMISQFALLKCAIFAAIHPQFYDKSSFVTLVF